MDEGVQIRQGKRVGHLRLDRPEALNALTLEMIRAIQAALDRWAVDASVEVVVVDGAGDRGFCAGGDIRFVHDHAVRDPDLVRLLWREEYGLDAVVASYPKPVVTIADGITMGGGIGLASHATHRVVTERSALAMPEVQIGLAPDVGGLWLLARAPGELGTHAALTGARIGGPEAVTYGLADHVVRSSRLPELVDRLEWKDPGELLTYLRQPTSAATVLADREWIDECYAGADAATILARLDAHPEPNARAAARTIREASPTAVAVTLAALRRAGAMSSLEKCLVQDYRVSSHFLTHPDLVEGIRARVVDKDRAPRWRPDSVSDVHADEVEAFFEPVGSDLTLGPPPAERDVFTTDRVVEP